MRKKPGVKQQMYRKNVKKLASRHVTNENLRSLGGATGARVHLKKISKSRKNRDYYT